MKPSHPQPTKKRYVPPRQSTLGQMLDSVFLLALVYVSLMLPLLLGHGGDKGETASAGGSTWEQLGQNATMADQWGKLGFTPETAAPIVQNRFDYSIDPIMLAITAVVIVGYYVFVLAWSKKEYQDVIEERFGEQDQP
jgi:Ca2+/H+ antiporter